MGREFSLAEESIILGYYSCNRTCYQTIESGTNFILDLDAILTGTNDSVLHNRPLKGVHEIWLGRSVS